MGSSSWTSPREERQYLQQALGNTTFGFQNGEYLLHFLFLLLGMTMFRPLSAFRLFHRPNLRFFYLFSGNFEAFLSISDFLQKVHTHVCFSQIWGLYKFLWFCCIFGNLFKLGVQWNSEGIIVCLVDIKWHFSKFMCHLQRHDLVWFCQQ